MDPVPVTHSISLPDELRLARALRAPELGPRILFFTGGSAMRSMSRRLKRYTHNSTHLITPFDSGGSSAKIRDAFGILSVGDIRNRLVALADETLRGNPQTYELFVHRLPVDASAAELEALFQQLCQGTHPLIASVPEPILQIARRYLQTFAEERPGDFDLRGASVGNLLLTGGYLASGRDIDAVIYIVARMISVLGSVYPITDACRDLRAELADGTVIVGQHRITGKEQAPITSPIESLTLVSSLTDPQPASASAPADVLRRIRKADLVCFPMGSFWTSLVANLLPSGVGTAIQASLAPKIYVPNVGVDPEQLGLSVHDCVRILNEQVARDSGEERNVIDFVLVDSKHADYGGRLDVGALEAQSVRVIDLPLARDTGGQRLDPERLAETLVSMV